MPNTQAKFVKQTDVLPQSREAVNELHHYMVQLYALDGRVGSGVFVNTCGVHGILTAHHVSKMLLQNERFGLCIAEYAHSLWVEKAHIGHVVIGKMNDDEEKLKDGPDLAFIIIRDEQLLGTIKSKKSFTYLDSQDLTVFEKSPEHLLWGVVGCPFKDSVVENGGLKVGLYSFSGMAIFKSLSERNGFDYLELQMPCDGEKYPADFQGLSGGGIWAITFKAGSPTNSIESIKHMRPVLAGISFYQSLPENGLRTITGHGFRSIYLRLREHFTKAN